VVTRNSSPKELPGMGYSSGSATAGATSVGSDASEIGPRRGGDKPACRFALRRQRFSLMLQDQQEPQPRRYSTPRPFAQEGRANFMDKIRSNNRLLLAACQAASPELPRRCSRVTACEADATGLQEKEATFTPSCKEPSHVPIPLSKKLAAVLGGPA
jgi:hypothetical protein